MKKLLYVGMCLWALLFLFSCDKEDVNGYTPLPKIHLGETFRYQCGEENYTRLEYDTLGQAAVLNFYKDEVTSLDCVDYDENSCTFSFHKGKTGLYRISWDYTSENLLRIYYGQNGMWYRMNTTGTHEYVLEANDGMAVKMVVYRASQDSIHCTVNRFCIEEYKEEE
ncbi:hypothetical protein [Phocaeicola sp.]|uniref:hypothetical protein n=1 Tax=Phocaeicola sp. TaxID=2773926 RepID=UPI00284B36C7|nr:hypothetical protein [Phocaeicola sp.]MDR3796006.1 hypothetical protein [Phocaeicola sp.]